MLTKDRLYELAYRALDEIKAQLEDADGCINTFNWRTQGGWYYHEGEEAQMEADAIELGHALKFLKELKGDKSC